MDRAKELYVPTGGKWNDQKKTMFFPHLGTQIRFRYLDRDADAGHYQGRNINFIGIDEAGQFPMPTGIDMLWGAMRSANGVPVRLRLTGNPGGPGHGWLKKRYVDPIEPGRIQNIELPTGRIHHRVFIPSFVSDNRELLDSDPDYISRLYLVGAKWLVDAWLRGDWNARPTGHFFDTTRIRYGEPPPMRYKYLAVDTATKSEASKDKAYKDRDPTAMAVIGIDHLRRFWILDMVVGRMDSSEWVNRMFTLHAKHGFERIWVEGGPVWAAVEPWAYQMMKQRQTILPVRMCPPGAYGDKGVRATPLQVILNNGGVWVPKDGTPWLDELLTELSIFQPDLARKDEIHDDQVDALAWAALMLMRMKTNPDPASPAVTGVGPIGRLYVENGKLDGKAAEAILARMKEMRKSGDTKFNPHDF